MSKWRVAFGLWSGGYTIYGGYRGSENCTHLFNRNDYRIDIPIDLVARIMTGMISGAIMSVLTPLLALKQLPRGCKYAFMDNIEKKYTREEWGKVVNVMLLR
jgi:hypothetical protein